MDRRPINRLTRRRFAEMKPREPLEQISALPQLTTRSPPNRTEFNTDEFLGPTGSFLRPWLCAAAPDLWLAFARENLEGGIRLLLLRPVFSVLAKTFGQTFAHLS